MTKKKRVNKTMKLEKRIYKLFMMSSVFLVIGIIYSNAMMGKINLEIQELSATIKEETDDNQSLVMKINEMVSLDKIQEVSTKLGLKYDNNNIKSVLE